MSRRLLALSIVLGCLSVAAGCGRSKPAVVPTTAEQQPLEVRPDLVPPNLAGLTVTTEDVTELEKKAGSQSYLASTRLWAVRAGDHLRATMQISRFVPDARTEDEGFRQRVVGQISSAGSHERLLGGQTVFATSANQQPVYIWFRGQSLFVLSVAADYPQPRAVLREALELQP